MADTKERYEEVIRMCRNVYEDKLKDYSPSWRIMRPESITDQILIKARRIRSLEIKKESKISEGIKPEFIGIVNYGIIGIIQLKLGFADEIDISYGKAMELYDKYMNETKELMYAKNHDYDDAWKWMRISSYIDLILTKLNRIKEIENNKGKVSVSEGIDANYADIINYSLFGLIKLTFPA
ncbi:MAG: DUF1599 domain-containing protein [Tannerella sp.]|jgi:transcription initiation factor TFIIIB Brf1 subunit/transcription initiation factor TFIIB|nr:DUF1599 domain-containing protein [Tannerella sp.]